MKLYALPPRFLFSFPLVSDPPPAQFRSVFPSYLDSFTSPAPRKRFSFLLVLRPSSLLYPDFYHPPIAAASSRRCPSLVLNPPQQLSADQTPSSPSHLLRDLLRPQPKPQDPPQPLSFSSPRPSQDDTVDSITTIEPACRALRLT